MKSKTLHRNIVFPGVYLHERREKILYDYSFQLDGDKLLLSPLISRLIDYKKEKKKKKKRKRGAWGGGGGGRGGRCRGEGVTLA